MSGPGRVLITGSTGFVGPHLIAALAPDHELTLADRDPGAADAAHQRIALDLVTEDFPEGIECVVHLAGMNIDREGAGGLPAFRGANRDLTLALARRALEGGVAKFVFLSTIKAELTPGSGAGDGVSDLPGDYYGLSKREAEEGLEALFGQGAGAARCVTLRPPIVYGPGNRAQMLLLLKAAARGLPLPLGGAGGKRSMIYVGNLAHAVRAVVEDERADRPAFSTYNLSDGQDLTAGEFYALLTRAATGRARVFPFPVAALRAGAGFLAAIERMLGVSLPLRPESVLRLLEESSFDSGPFARDFDWRPPFAVEEGVAATVDWFRART